MGVAPALVVTLCVQEPGTCVRAVRESLSSFPPLPAAAFDRGLQLLVSLPVAEHGL